MAKEIVVDISPAGSVQIDAQGFQGKSCEDATQALEVVIGGQVSKNERKGEFYMPEMTTGQTVKRTF